MPGFVKTPKDERRWAKAKEHARKQTAEGSESFWKLSNYIFHRMGKSKEDKEIVRMYKKELENQGLIKESGITKLANFLHKTRTRCNLIK
jgi:hypothetical protein